MVSEFEMIARHFAPLAYGYAGAYGLLDDAAVISPSSGSELVVKTDAIVGDIDFPPLALPGNIARKALRVNLSDLAAKGARPRAYLVDLIVPAEVDEAWIAAFARGLADDQREYDITLIGGDMSSTSGPIVVAVSAFGEAPLGRIIRRGGARAHDGIFVTGTIGDAALGLAVLRAALPGLDSSSVAFLLHRYRLPQPRVALGPELIGVATAGTDISDGLIADLRHICEVSGLDAVIEAGLVPLSRAACEAVTVDSRWLSTVLVGGDDYELLFTAPAAAAARIDELSRSHGVPITRIGGMTDPSQSAGSRLVVLDRSGRQMAFPAEGWTHFGSRP